MKAETEELIHSFLQSAGNLPTLPGIALRILNAVQQEETGLKEIGDILRSDPPLAAKVLKIANSSLYGRKVSTVQHAVNLLGAELIRNLVLSFSLIQNIRAEDSSLFNYSRFWKDSLVNAIASRWIQQRRFPSLKEDAFIAGLIHNIGILILVRCAPLQYRQIQEMALEQDLPLYLAEEKVLELNHLQVGHYLARQWGFPNNLIAPIAYHHFPEYIYWDDSLRIIAETVQISSRFTEFFHAREKGPELALLEQTLNQYGLQELMDVQQLVTHIQEQTRDVFPVFELSVKDDLDYLQIVEEARQELINTSSEFLEKYLSQQKEMDRLKIQAQSDPLTGTDNHQKFMEELEKKLEQVGRHGGCFSFCFLDIDDFKEVNDNYGHLAGDKVLMQVAQHLKDHTRKIDTLARYGGDEFVLLLPDLSAQKGYQGMERIRRELAEKTFEVEGKRISVTASCGVFCVSSSTKLDKEEVLKQADHTMYLAKRADKNITIVGNP